MKKITQLCFILIFFCSYLAIGQYDFPTIPGPVNVANGSPVTLDVNDAGNSAGVPSGTYSDFSVTVDWTAGGGGPWSSEADLTFVDNDESVLINPPTSGAANSGAPTTMTFSGTLATPYNASVDGTLDIILNQSFSGSDANWSNITVTLDGFAPDPNAPIIACPGDVMTTTDPGQCGAVVNYATPAAIDPNGGSVTVVQTSPDPGVLASGDEFPVGTTTVTFTATNDDAPNESSSCSFDIVVMDDEAPTMDCPAAITQTNDLGDCGAVVTVPAPMIMDNCPIAGGTLTNDYNGTDDATDFYPVGTTTVTFTYDDGSGNTVDCTVDVTVTDDEAPMIVCQGEPGVFNILEDFEGGTIPAGWSTNVVSGGFDWTFGSGDMPGGTDFPTNAAIFDDDAAGSGELDNTVQLLSPVYDMTGADMASLTFDYSIQDFAGSGTFQVEVFDGAAWQEILFVDNTDQTPTTFGPLDVLGFANADFQVRYTYDDEDDWAWGAGVDNFALDYSIASTPPLDVVLDVDGNATVNVADLIIGATDNCAIDTITTFVDGTVDGSITTIFDSNNGLGGGSAVYFDITVGSADVEISDIDLNTGDGGAFTVEMYTLVGTYVGNEQDPAPWSLAATGSGTASGTVNVPSNAVFDSPVTLAAGTTYGVALVMDASHGHSYSGTGSDPSPGMPTYTNGDLTLSLGASASTPFSSTPFSPRIWNGTINYTIMGGGDVTTFDVTCDDIGENSIDVDVTDVNGNTSTCTATINVIDNTAPDLVCQDFTLELGEDGTAMLDPFDLIDMTATVEACGIDNAAVDIDDFDCSDIGTPVTVTLFVSDPSGNTATCTAVVTVVDMLEPVLTCPADQTVDPGAGNQLYEVPDYFATGEATALDNCTDPIVMTTQDPAPGEFLGDGVYTVTLTATDDSGNTATCTFELTVESVLGVNDSELANGVTIFPNPANGQFTISNNSNILLDRATMYDVNGRLVNTIDLTGMQGQRTVDISQLAVGIYVVKIEAEGSSVVKRLAVE